MDAGGWTVDVPYDRGIEPRTAAVVTLRVTLRVTRRVVRGLDSPVSLWHWCLALSRLLGF
jgi:hypothetical protein